MLDPYLFLAPLFLLPVMGLLGFVGCIDFSRLILKAIEIDPANPPPLGPGDQQQFMAYAIGEDDSRTLLDPAMWSPNAAPNGLYTAPSVYSVSSETVTASDSGMLAGTVQVNLFPVVVSLTPATAVLKSGEQQTFTATASPTTVNQLFTWQHSVAPLGLTFNNTPTQLTVQVTPGSSSGQFAVTASSQHYPSAPSGTATVTVIGNTAILSGNNNPDITTQGNWIVNNVNVYGSKGYLLADIPDVKNPPAFLPSLPISIEPAILIADPAPQVDPRYLLHPDGHRIGYAWEDAVTLSADIDFSDYQPHQIAVYFLDFGATNIQLTVEMLDGDDTAKPPLTTTHLANLNTTPTYAVWVVTGHVKMLVTKTNGSLALFSGIFFD